MLRHANSCASAVNWTTAETEVKRKSESEHSIYVADLPPDATEAELVTLFSPLFPSCRSAKILIKKDGDTKASGFVQFGDESDWQRALASFSRTESGTGLILRGQPLIISDAIRTPSEMASPAAAAKRILYDSTSPKMTRNPLPPNSSPTRGMAVKTTSKGKGNGRISSPIASATANNDGDAQNTVAFVGGLPGFISEEALRALFQVSIYFKQGFLGSYSFMMTALRPYC